MSLTNRILLQFKQRIQAMELQPSSGGCFEVKLNDESVYSKLETGRFPDEDQVLADLAARIG